MSVYLLLIYKNNFLFQNYYLIRIYIFVLKMRKLLFQFYFSITCDDMVLFFFYSLLLYHLKETILRNKMHITP